MSASDFTLGKYAKLLFEHFSHLDSKLLKSLWLLVSRPGFLTAEYVAGRHKVYMKPLQLFLVVNLIFFLLLGSNDVFAPKVKWVYKSNATTWSGKSVQTMTDEYAAREQITTDAAIMAIDKEISVYTKAMLYVLVPILGLLFYALFFRQNPYYLCNLIFATHWFAFLLIFIMLSGALLSGIFHLRGMYMLGALLALLMPYHAISTRRFYGQNWPIIVAKTIIFMAGFTVIYFLYRDVILNLVFWMG